MSIWNCVCVSYIYQDLRYIYPLFASVGFHVKIPIFTVTFVEIIYHYCISIEHFCLLTCKVLMNGRLNCHFQLNLGNVTTFWWMWPGGAPGNQGSVVFSNCDFNVHQYSHYSGKLLNPSWKFTCLQRSSLKGRFSESDNQAAHESGLCLNAHLY